MNACIGTLADLFTLCFLIKMLHNNIYPYLLNKTKLIFELLTISITFQSSTQLCIYHVPPDNVLIPKHHLLAGQYWQLRPCLKCFLGWCHCLQHLCLCGFWYPCNYLQYWNIMNDRSFEPGEVTNCNVAKIILFVITPHISLHSEHVTWQQAIQWLSSFQSASTQSLCIVAYCS